MSGHWDADELPPREIGAFLDVPKGKIQRNRQVAVLSAIYGKAIGRWYVAEKNPCSKVERNPSKPRDRYITDTEYLRVYACAPEKVQVAMDLAYLTSQRQGDIVALRWDQISPAGIEVKQGKTGKRFIIALSPSLRAVLARAKRLSPNSPWVVPTRHDVRYTSEGFRALWQRVMRKAMATKALEVRHTFHDIRAKSVSDNPDINAASRLAGHSTLAMTRQVYDRGVRTVQPLQ